MIQLSLCLLVPATFVVAAQADNGSDPARRMAVDPAPPGIRRPVGPAQRASACRLKTTQNARRKIVLRDLFGA